MIKKKELEKKAVYQERRGWISIRFSDKPTKKPQSVLMPVRGQRFFKTSPLGIYCSSLWVRVGFGEWSLSSLALYYGVRCLGQEKSVLCPPTQVISPLGMPVIRISEILNCLSKDCQGIFYWPVCVFHKHLIRFRDTKDGRDADRGKIWEA